jgi:prepilin-type N-terminal cleavage/methylation domain-containing protein
MLSISAVRQRHFTTKLKKEAPRSGFSLLELSIVLVIIGLLAGGVMVGQDLVRQAELRTITTDLQKYLTAINAFKNKYQAFPGDMRNAQSYWGVAHATPATCITTVSAGTETCNGNADSILLTSTGSNEVFRFWQHLSNASLIEGSYTGVAGSGGNSDATIGVNVPEARISGSGWSAHNWGTQSGSSAFDGFYGNYLVFGAKLTTQLTGSAILTPAEMFSIDAKMDDGKPGMGKIVPRNFANCSAATASNQLTVDYALTINSSQCALIYRQAF